MKRIIVLVPMILWICAVHAQITNRDNYDLKRPDDMKKDCGDLHRLLDSAPVEVRFGTLIDGDSVVLYYNDPDLF